MRSISVCGGNVPFVILLSLALLLTQCAPLTRKQEMVPNRPETRVMPAKSEVVRTALIRALVKKHYALNDEKSNSQHVQTEWLEEGKHRNMIRADLKPVGQNKTEVTLQVFIQKRKLFKEEWEPMDVVGEDTYRIIMGDLEMECYRVLYDGT